MLTKHIQGIHTNTEELFVYVTDPAMAESPGRCLAGASQVAQEERCVKHVESM